MNTGDSVVRGAAVAVVAMTGSVLAIVGTTGSGEAVGRPSLDTTDAAAALVADVTDAGSTTGPVTTRPPEPPVGTGPRAAEPDVVDTAALVADALRAGEAEPTRTPDEREEDDRPVADEEQTPEAVERPEESSPTGGDCDVDTSALGRVKPHVREAAAFLGCRYGEPTMAGVAGRGGPSDHPNGLAVDFMVDRATGDAIAACALRNKEALGITYVIWRQRMNHGSGWKGMEDRGDATANHMDHVHVSFGKGGGSASPRC